MDVLCYTGLTAEQLQRFDELEKALGESVYPLADAYFDGVYDHISQLYEPLQSLTASESKLLGAMLLVVVRCAQRKAQALTGREQELFLAACSDISSKVNECLAYKKAFGTFVLNWYHGLIKAHRVALGRLQFDLGVYSGPEIQKDSFILREGDRKLQCHIPSGKGPLTEEACMDAFRQAWQEFPAYRKDGILPILCDSWLLYPPYAQVFPPQSNVGKFRALWTLYQQKEQEGFPDCWRVFSMDLPEKLEILPRNTRMQRAFADYLSAGGSCGGGAGIVLFDGKQLI